MLECVEMSQEEVESPVAAMVLNPVRHEYEV